MSVTVDLSYARRFPDTCCEEVSRRGELQPCEQPAVAVRRDPDGGPPYPVCRHHTHLRRGDLVPLSILLGGNDGSTTSGSVSPALPETGE